MEPSRFISIMRHCASTFHHTKDEPCLGLTASELGQIRVPVAVINHLQPGTDYYARHLPDVARKLARAIPNAVVTVSPELMEWWGAVVAFKNKHRA